MTKGEEEKQQLNNDVKVVICGGGPGGLLTSILLHKIGIPSTVLEATTEPDQWNSKSYTLVLGDKGKGSLEKGGCLESAMEAGIERKFIYFFDGQTGETKAIPKKSPGIGFTRPLLVQVLEKMALENHHPGVTMKRGAGVSRVTKDDTDEGLSGGGGSLQVHLEDGTVIPATHVIGADGKWSKVRQSFPSLNSQGTMITCPSFGVHMNCPIVPDGWKTDGTYVIRPISNDGTFYMIISPRPEEAGLSIGMVCFDELLEKYPWLSPPDDMKSGDYGKGGWNDEYSALPDSMKSDVTLSDHLEALFQQELPAFYEKIGNETLQTARINRRVTWLQMTAEEGTDVTYTTEDGHVTLIGDASHAMTPSMGEGCNTALESAVKLVDCISSIMEEKGESATVTATATATATGGCSIETMSEAFMKYGSSRPKEMQPIQEASAARNIMKK